MALQHKGKCVGGPYDGQDWVYFAETMPVVQLLGNPLTERSYTVDGYYKHHGTLWFWQGPSIKQIAD
jgi:hypothetical protein